MSFGQAISHNLSNMTNFSGRAGRPEFWWWVLFLWLVSVVVNLLTGGYNFASTDRGLLGWIGIVISVLLWLATLAVTVRRLHDTGRSGWWVLLWFVCCIGAIVVVVFCVQPSQPADNQYGPPPAA
jgi:uncharacterized membrane protein YhaH (DUF805 family)